MSILLRKLFGQLREEHIEGADTGGAPATDPLPAGETGETSGEPAAAQPEPAAGESAPADTDEPKTMLEAIEKGLKSPEQQKKAEGLPPKDEGKKPDGEPKLEDMTQMPEGLSVKAQQRFAGLVTALKETNTKYEQLQQEHEQVAAFQQNYTAMIRDIGATPEQLQGAAVYLKALNDGDMQTRRNLLINELRDVSLQMGQPIDDIFERADPLPQFPDLLEAVNSYHITREHALEVARLRAGEAQRQAQVQAQQQAEQQRADQVQAWVREKDQQMGAIKAESLRLARTDPLYPRVEALMMSRPEDLKAIIEKTPPSTWTQQFSVLYSQLRQAVASQAPAAGEPRPLSGGGGKPSGSAAAPKSMYEAMFGGR
jgi:hypothetical protein